MATRPPHLPLHRATALLATILWLVSACVTVGIPPQGSPAAAAPGQGIVVGRVRWFESDREQYPWGTGLDLGADILGLAPPPLRRPVLGIFGVNQGKRALPPSPDSKGWFCWELPADTYLLYLLDDLHGGDSRPGQFAGSPWLRVLAALRVAPQAAPAYVGDLVVDLEADWLFGAGTADYSVVDVQAIRSPDEARAWMNQVYPGSTSLDASRPMRVDPALTWLLRDYHKSTAVAVLRELGLE